MPWGRLHDRANGNAKLLALSDSAWRMWGCGLIYCQDNLTDGFIPADTIHAFGVKAKNKQAVADELCRSLIPGKGPLWHKVQGGYQVHDYLDWNDPREKILEERAKTHERVKRFRKRSKNGDGNALQPPLVTGDPQPQPQDDAPAERAPDQRKAHPIRELLGHYQKRYEAIFSLKPHIDGGKDAACISGLLKQHDEATVRRALDAYFDQADEFVKQNGYELGLFRRQFNRWLAKASSAAVPSVGPPPSREDLEIRRNNAKYLGGAR